MTDELIRAVKSLIIDIESMQNGSGFGDDSFGPFSESEIEEEGTTVVWPNLAISVEAVKKLLEPTTIEGELAAKGITHG